MNLRHAAALAFVGWYLLLPPPGKDPKTTIDTSWPLRYWFKSQTFKSKAECEKTKIGLINLPRDLSKPEDRGDLEGEKAGLCVSDEDPRLKQN